MNGKFVAYYRVSTAQQGRSGLGLDAQRDAVSTYLNGGSWSSLGDFTEIESGRNNARPQLAAALALCRLTRAKLVIAKLDRLARNVHFVSGLIESGVEFIATDMPTVNRLTVHILAAVAEEEARMISTRTKVALQAAKARGAVLGGWRGGPKVNSELGRAAQRRHADVHAGAVAPIAIRLRDAGKSLRQIAAELTERDIETSRGGRWTAQAVANVLARQAA